MSDISYDVLVSDMRPLPGRPTPDGSPAMWSPTSATLITSGSSSVLVDGMTTSEDGASMVAWIESRDTTLEAIYITHGHGDHFFGLAPVLARYPGTPVLALPPVVEHMRHEWSGAAFEKFWVGMFGDQLPDTFVEAVATGATFDLNDHTLEFVHAGQSDTVDTTFVHVPDADLVVAGDIVYNGVFPYVVDTSVEKRAGWRASLDLIAERQPAHVVGGHKAPGAVDAPEHIENTRQYLLDFDEVLAQGGSAAKIYTELVARHPDRLNRSALWAGAVVLSRLRDAS